MSICPLCNGLRQVFLSCPNCGGELEDLGMLEYYFEPYSPYLDEEILDQADGVSPDECIHLFNCPLCGYERHYIVARS